MPKLQQISTDCQSYIDSVSNGNFETKLLRQHADEIMGHYGGSLSSTMERFTGQLVLLCSMCNRYVFAAKSVSAYNGAHSICDMCVKAYSVCKQCNTYILTTDLGNPSHIHLEPNTDENFMVNDGEVQAWNADIMIGSPRQSNFYKTPKEELIWKHQKESYHDTLHKAHYETPFRYFGVEIEVEKVSAAPPDMILRTYKQFPEHFVMVKHDGSLSQKGKGGFEIVTMPGTLAYHKSGVWDGFFDNLGGFFQASAPTAGIHVHAGLGTITKIVSGKMLLFINAARNREFIESIAERTIGIPNPNGKLYMSVNDGVKISDVVRTRQHDANCCWSSKNKMTLNRYKLAADGTPLVDNYGNPIIASIKPGSITVRPACKCVPGLYHSTKYEAFNLMTKRPTVELRIFRGIVQKEFLFSAIEFTDALADYCSESSPDKLNYQDFLAWMAQFNPSGKSKLYPNLSRHLINKSWLDPKKSPLKPGVN